MTCAQLRTKTRTSISRKICCVRLGFQILYAVEQFSSLFSKDKYTKPMIRLPRACRGRTAVQISANSSHMCCVELALKGLASAGKGLLYPNPNPGGVWKTNKKTQVFPGHWPTVMSCWCETAIHGCHCPRDMAARVREVIDLSRKYHNIP